MGISTNEPSGNIVGADRGGDGGDNYNGGFVGVGGPTKDICIQTLHFGSFYRKFRTPATFQQTTTTSSGITTGQPPFGVVQFNHQLSTLAIKAAITILLTHHEENFATLSPYLFILEFGGKGDTSQKRREIMKKG